MNMPTKTLLSLATVALLAVTVRATSVNSANDWFTADISNVDDSSVWTKPSVGGSATNGDGMICVDTGANDPLIYSPAEKTGDIYCVTGTLTIVRCATAPSALPNSPSVALGALAATSDSWYGVSNSVWVALSGVDVPADDATDYDVMIEFTTNATRQVRYSVNYVPLTNSFGVAWFACGAGSSNTEVKNVGIAGCSNVKALGAEIVSVYEVDVSTDRITEVGVELGLDTEDPQKVLNAYGRNGIKVWESLVLGLNPTDANAKPFAAPVQTANSNLGFTLGNVDTSTHRSNAKVSFDVYECNVETGAITEGTKGHADVGGTVEFAPNPLAVKYYKIKITITK